MEAQMNRLIMLLGAGPWLFVGQSLDDPEYTLTALSDSGSYFVYAYTLRNPASSTWGLYSATMDISASSGTPTSLPATGPFNDLPPKFPGATPYAQVGPISPTGWEAIMDTRSELVWFAPADLTTSSDSVAPGDSLTGFGLRSSYSPGLRQMKFEPTVESCCQEPFPDTTDGIFWPLPGSYAVTGWSVGPRYKPEEITIDVLQSQAAAVCSHPLWIDDNETCSALADSLDRVEDFLAVLNYPGAKHTIEKTRSLLGAEREPSGYIEDNAYWLLDANLTQLEENLPDLGLSDI